MQIGRRGRPIGHHRLQDFVTVSQVAKELKMNSDTIKRWLRLNKVDGVVWGRDRRNWIVVHKNSVRLLEEYRDAVWPKSPTGP